MSLTTVAELRSALGVGSLYPDATLQEVCDASDAVLLPMLWANVYFNVAHSNTATTGTLYFSQVVKDLFYVGQTVVITNNESHLNGSKTITAVGDYTITFAITGNNNTVRPKHEVNPYGTVTASATTDWTADAAVQQAALMISVDIWQARQVSSTGGVSPDFTPSPYRMGNTLLARVRGLIAHALSPNSMVG
jgi:hypothetical protein